MTSTMTSSASEAPDSPSGRWPRRRQRSRVARHRSLSLIGATDTNGLSLRNDFSPMPRTFIRSSIFLKPPFFWRYSMILAAVAGPMPGSVSSSALEAVFRLIGVDGPS